MPRSKPANRRPAGNRRGDPRATGKPARKTDVKPAQKAGAKPMRSAAPAPKRPPQAVQPPATRGPVVVHVLSDSTGNLAQHMLTAFLTQFPNGSFVVRGHNFLDTPTKLHQAMERLGAVGGIVFHALVGPQAKHDVKAFCQHRGLPCCDLTGRFVEFLSKSSGIAPQADIERLHRISDEYHSRIKAVEFTLEHDDGLGLDTIHQADIVLTGVSRTSKTPTSIYLAQQGYRTANVSLALEVQPPRQLLALPPTQVVGLVIDPHRLVEIRSTRQVSWRMEQTSYSEFEHVQKEVTWSRRLFASRGWPILDVTHQAVEETAARVVELMGVVRSV